MARKNKILVRPTRREFSEIHGCSTAYFPVFLRCILIMAKSSYMCFLLSVKAFLSV